MPSASLSSSSSLGDKGDAPTGGREERMEGGGGKEVEREGRKEGRKGGRAFQNYWTLGRYFILLF